MKRLRLLNPIRLYRVVRDVRRASRGGGPRAVRVVAVGEPRGLVLPSSSVEFEVVSRDDGVERFRAEIPVPWPYAWSYRVARRLGLPLVSSFDPGRVRFQVPVPRLWR